MSTPTDTAVRQGVVTDDATTPVDLDDPREQIEVGVLLANGRLAGRRFASRAEAEAWARPDEGDQVVEYNLVCECSV
jgi:hypothetical protein